MTLRLLDLCSKAGGTSRGYADAGFNVVCVDIEPQRNNPFEFHQADAFEFLTAHGHEFDAVAGSWPCQAFTLAQKIRGRTHPDLIAPGRQAQQATGLPWVIENVPGAPLRDPIEICGCMFPTLGVYRERWFETGGGFTLPQPLHRYHSQKITKMGRPPKTNERMHVVGNFSGVQQARTAMGIEWMTRDELREAIPPLYTRWIGLQLYAHIEATRLMANPTA